MQKAQKNAKLLVDLSVNFCLDRDAFEQKHTEQVVIDYAAKKGENSGQELVQTLRSIASRENVQNGKSTDEKK